MAVSDVAALARAGRGLLVALDFDGTLAPIVRDPTTSRPVPGARRVVADLLDQGARVALITGREARVVLDLGGFRDLPGLTVDGVYGAQRYRDGTTTSLPVPEGMRAARTEIADVLRRSGVDTAVWVEDKDVSFVVHTRLAADPDAALRDVVPPVADLAARHGLRSEAGKQVVEVRVPDVDKGRALDALLTEADPAALLWAGDDLGDLPAFAALRRFRERTGRPALGVGVAPGLSPDPLVGDVGDPGGLDPRVAAVADVVVDGPAALVALLESLVQARTAAS